MHQRDSNSSSNQHLFIWFRYFHVKKADYTFYGQEQGGGAAGGGGGTTIPNEDHEMTYVAGMFPNATLAVSFLQ